MANGLKQQLDTVLTKILDTYTRELVQNLFENNIKVFNEQIDDISESIEKNRISLDKASLIVIRYMRNLLKRADGITKVNLDRQKINRIKQLFRESIKDFINKSLLMQLSYIKPKGQPGDYKLIEMLYENKPLSEGIGFCGDKYVLQDSYVKAIRIRKEMMKKMLINFIRKTQGNSIDIMNIGCGSCREIQELFIRSLSDKEIIFTLVDWDKEALDFAQKSLSRYCFNTNLKFKYINENILIFYKQAQKYYTMFGKQDLIYSIGLVDYVPDSILGDMIKFCFELLNENGILIMAHKNIKVRKNIGSDWACDWNFYPRNENDVKSIVEKSLLEKRFKIKVIHERTKHIFFIHIAKLCN